jgi:hypothetical protein
LQYRNATALPGRVLGAKRNARFVDSIDLYKDNVGSPRFRADLQLLNERRSNTRRRCCSATAK